jgi:hypothetical protein
MPQFDGFHAQIAGKNFKNVLVTIGTRKNNNAKFHTDKS